jgi:cyclopropane-fatty-acyl-phospholipid synthase
MNHSHVLAHKPSSKLHAAPRAARQVLSLLDKMPHGVLELQLPDGHTLQFSGSHHGHGRPLQARIELTNWGLFERALKSGDIGVAEAYIDGDWTTPDLSALLQLFIVNRAHLERVVYGSWWGSLLHRLKHRNNRNSRAGSAKNIHAHYDLGNDFYKLWLDPTMNYSSAWFEGVQDRSQADLSQAQTAKVRRALQQARVGAGSRVLEVGCGWGALAELAAAEFGAQVTGVTLSNEQLAWGQQRLAQAGLAQQTDLRFQDYRDLPAQHAAQGFDAIVSIEMFEAVGREYWPAYFDALKRCLKPGGYACIQTITIRDDLFERYVRSTDFIQQYIFPGGVLPSPQQFEAHAQAAGFVVQDTLAFGLDYAETLRRWRNTFMARQDEARALGFDTRFVRIWEFYLAYCEAAFEQGNTNVVQYTLQRP